jgi:uncharacterized protein YndB with AHSA1/START domain
VVLSFDRRRDEATVGDRFVWRPSLASSPEHVFELVDTDEGRERFWALRSRVAPDGFDLEWSAAESRKGGGPSPPQKGE